MDLEKYKNRIEYPMKPTKPRLFKNATPDQIRGYADMVEIYDRKFAQWKKEMEKYQKESAELMQQFKRDVLLEYEIYDHPKANQLFSIAWENGHAGGLAEVAGWVDELCCLLKD